MPISLFGILSLHIYLSAVFAMVVSYFAYELVLVLSRGLARGVGLRG